LAPSRIRMLCWDPEGLARRAGRINQTKLLFRLVLAR
jgi:hypothetical protein